MKKTIILAIFALMLMTLPAEARAFKIERIFDPACIVLCDNEPDVVNNTNSNNVNSNVNSPNSNVVTSGTTATTPVVVTTQTPVYVYDNNNYTSPLSVSCYSSYMNSNVGDRIVWSASVSGGNGNYFVTWSGTDGLSGNGSSISITYNNPGTKTASVVVTSGGQTVTRNCNTVIVSGYSTNNYYNNYNYDGYYNGYYNNNYNNYYNGSYNPYYSSQPLTVSCTANTSAAPVGATVRWVSYVSGGYGGYAYTWTGTDNIYGTGQNVDVIYNSGGTKTASLTVRSNGQIITQACTNSIAVSGPVVNYNNSYNSGTTNTVIKYVEVPAKASVSQKAKTTNTVVESNNSNTATLASLFSLSNVPWGLVAILIILILLFIIFYLMFNSKKI
jgi:hypothetical protein